ncbi:Signal transduction histidine kinase [Chitinophaga sp. CF118]|uniref:sensor histidine kinase n=1 Tax=Chitinophaga sp. CF118 TaxID=1884367 RepID=UPI0008E87A58|nr:HAMP domain-containing sensor histidine kinase [Chitinophaga sp. CF118]SFD84849.1 Signal transduction histidine kinase [Chitinophaga sp. CF118]
MKLYLFSPIESAFREEFNYNVRNLNLKVTGVVSFVVAIAASVVRIIADSLPQTHALPQQQFRELSTTNICMISGSFLVACIVFIIRKKVPVNRQNQYYFITLLYSQVVISCTMAVTFIAQHNPKNTMTMLLIGVLVVAVAFIIAIWELLILIGITGIIFTLFIHLFQVNPVTLAMNHFVFWEIMLCFFVISRLLYSYHANYFIKIKTIEKKNQEIAQANQMKTEILAIVAHDLRNPISGIRSIAHLMQEYPYTPDQETKYMEWIMDACKTADQIIEELLLAAQKNDGNKLQTNYISLNQWIENVRDNWVQQSKHNRKVLLELHPKEIKAHIDTAKMQRVVENLLHNAVKFTPEDGAITLGVHTHRGGIRISVADTGIGIPQQLMPALFDRFTSSGRPGLNHEPSTGLGLHICKQLVQQHGGDIHVNSKENKGTTFNIDLPYSVL